MKKCIKKNFLKKCGKAIITVIVIFYGFSSLSVAQLILEQKNSDIEQFSLEQTVSFSVDDLEFDSVMGHDIVMLEDGVSFSDPGKPSLPCRQIRVALPKEMRVTNVYVTAQTKLELPNMYNILPVQPPHKISDSDKEFEFTEPDSVLYASEEPYPLELVKFVSQTDLAGQNIAVIDVYPIHWIPTDKKLTLYTDITFIIEGTTGYVCGDYLPSSISERGKKSYEKMVKEMVVNPEEVELVSDSPDRPQQLGLDPGNYDYVIIADGYWYEYQPLVDWKTKKGVPATIVTLSWIYWYGGYSGTNAEKIRSFIIDAHSDWGATFFLLGGDANSPPTYSKSFDLDDGTYTVPSDTYYADYDDDWVCEVHVGRASIRDSTHMNTFLNKVLTYETNPPLNNYAKTAFFTGFDLRRQDSAEGENCKEDIKDLYLPTDWIYRREYDSEPGGHKEDVKGYLNQGNNLVNHIDHSNTNVLGVGYTNHNTKLSSYDVSILSNGDRQSIMYSIGCWANNYPHLECISEEFIHNQNGGGLAFVGNTRYGWYSPYYDDCDSLRYDRYFFRSLFNQNHYILGECFSDHKNDAYIDDEYYQYIFYELSLLGDPEMNIWTEDPEALIVAHDLTLSTGTSSFSVHVEDSSGDLEDATVCLWKGDEVYLIETTDTSGYAYFTPAPTTEGTMYVTVTKHNYVPYEGEAVVIGNNPPDTPTTPTGSTLVPAGYSVEYSTTTTDPENNQVYYMWDWGDEVTEWIGPYTSGTIVTEGHIWNDYGYYEVKVKAKDTHDAESDWSAALTVQVTVPGDLDGDVDVDLSDLGALLPHYGQTSGMMYEDGDIDGDYDVDLSDLGALLANYGYGT